VAKMMIRDVGECDDDGGKKYYFENRHSIK